MADLLEILVCVLAVFGAYTVLSMIKTRLMYSRRVRTQLRAAIFINDCEDICSVVRYASYLRREQKISSERLIILTKDDIIENGEYLDDIGQVFAVRDANIIKCKETENDT